MVQTNTGGPKKLPLSALRDFRQYNRNRMLDWLSSWAGTSKGKPKKNPDELITPTGFGPQGPGSMSMARLESLLSEDIRFTDWLLDGIVDDMKKLRPREYRNLMEIYWADESSVGTLETWRKSPNTNLQTRAIAAEVTERWMLREAQYKLANNGRKRLVVLDPSASTRTAEALVRNERERKERQAEREKSAGRPNAEESDRLNRIALDTYYKILEETQDEAELYGRSGRWVAGEASRRTAEATGYTRRRIEQLRSELAGKRVD